MPATVNEKPRTWRARFRDLKVPVSNGVEYCRCTLEMELRPARGPWDHYHIFWAVSGRPQSPRAYTLPVAQDVVARMFREQLTPWRPVAVKSGGPLKTESTDTPPAR